MPPTGAQRIEPGRTPIVVIGDDWGRHVSTQQHLFRRLADSYPLIWVNSFGHRRPKLSWYDARRAARKVGNMLWGSSAQPAASQGGPRRVVHPRALPWHNHASVRRFNAWSLVRDIRAALAIVAPGERPLFVTGTPAAFGVIGQLDELASIYFCLDDYGEIYGVERELIAPLEREMLERVDAVVATAAALTVSKRPASGHTMHLPQGVNYSHFATPRPAPHDMAHLPRPIVGFAGGVGSAVNFAMVRHAATRLPNTSFVFVGPWQQDVSLESWPRNMHFLGARSYADLPAYVQAFDVGLIPYVHNDWTRAVDPLKLLEYLAAGVPVVTTALPEVFKYAEVVRIADDEEAFHAAIVAELTEASGPAADRAARRAERQAVAARHGWEQRAAKFLEFASAIVETGASERMASQGFPAAEWKKSIT